MKTNKKNVLLVLGTLLFLYTGFFSEISAQSLFSKDFRGSIVYRITFDSTDLHSDIARLMPHKMQIDHAGDFTRTHISSPVSNYTLIFNQKEHTSTLLLNIEDSLKYAIRRNTMPEAKTAKQPAILTTSETKNIMGYNCKKAFLVEKNDTLPLFYTQEIVVQHSGMEPKYHKIPGVLLDFYERSATGLLIRYQAVSVEEIRFKKRDFDIPQAYKVISQEEFNAIFGKQPKP